MVLDLNFPLLPVKSIMVRLLSLGALVGRGQTKLCPVERKTGAYRVSRIVVTVVEASWDARKDVPMDRRPSTVRISSVSVKACHREHTRRHEHQNPKAHGKARRTTRESVAVAWIRSLRG